MQCITSSLDVTDDTLFQHRGLMCGWGAPVGPADGTRDVHVVQWRHGIRVRGFLKRKHDIMRETEPMYSPWKAPLPHLKHMNTVRIFACTQLYCGHSRYSRRHRAASHTAQRPQLYCQTCSHGWQTSRILRLAVSHGGIVPLGKLLCIGMRVFAWGDLG